MAPLPAMDESERCPRNTGGTLIESVPVDAKRARYDIAGFELPPAIQANLRTGELFFNREGITVRGMARRADTTFDRLKIVGGAIIAVSLPGSLLSMVAPVFWKEVFVATPILIGALIVAINAVFERRCVPWNETIPWTSVLGAQTDRGQRWVSILYLTPRAGKGVAVPHFISLSGLSPTTVTNVADTISYFAPQANCVRLRGGEWKKHRKLIFACLAALVVIAAVTAGITLLGKQPGKALLH